MSDTPFFYQDAFPLGPDPTEYERISSDHVSVTEFEGQEMLKIAPEALTFLAAEAIKAINFTLRPAHLEQVAAILDDPEATENDRMVALMLLKNAEIASHGILPFCQDTGTAIIMGKKGQQVWTHCDDAEYLSRGIYDTYTKENLRYSQTAPLTMFDETNTRCNLPAQIDLYATKGDEYNFLFVSKGGGSANKTFLYQETKALLNPKRLKEFCREKMASLGTAACPPYHLAFVIGGTSAETCLKTVKLASTHYYDELPTTGNEHGRAFRDLAGNTLPWTCESSVCRATVHPVPSDWGFLARRTAKQKRRSPRKGSFWRNSRKHQAGSSRKNTAIGNSKVCRSTSTSGWRKPSRHWRNIQ